MLPLHIESNIEATLEKTPLHLSRFERLKLIFFAFVKRRPPAFGRLSVLHQLQERACIGESNCLAAWKIVHGPWSDVLHILKRELYWPNICFIPEDPFKLCLTTDYDDFPWEWFYIAINEQFGTKYNNDDFQLMMRLNWTIGQFVQDLQKRLGP